MDDHAHRLPRAIAAAAADTRHANLALMHLLIAVGSDPGLPDALSEAARRASGPEATRLRALSSLLRQKPDAARTVAEVMAEADHEGAGSGDDAVARWARIFDALALRHPAASVALYSLGDEELLARATGEVVSWLEALGLPGPDRAVLDLGCGTGRIGRALAPRCGLVVGADVSHGMLAQAAAKPEPGLSFARTSGRDLAPFRGEAFDTVVACDVFPYLVAASLAADLVGEIARVLKPGGHAAILNLSYRGDEARDRADAAEWARAAGLRVVLEAERPFTVWDGRAWLWRKPE